MKKDIPKRKSFKWTLKLQDIPADKNLASPHFDFERNMFRCIWMRTATPQKMVVEQLVFSTPLTVSAR